MIRLGASATWSIVHCLVPDTLWDKGMGQLMIARRTPDRLVACGVFLLDTYFMGVKNAFWTVVSDADCDVLIEKLQSHGRLEEVEPEYLAKLLDDAVAYARELGAAPHRDYRYASLLLSGIDRSLCTDEFEFGCNGKPLYIEGPFDAMDRRRMISNQPSQDDGDYEVSLKRIRSFSEEMFGIEDDDDDDNVFDEEHDPDDAPDEQALP
jgi:hypothetical protein